MGTQVVLLFIKTESRLGVPNMQGSQEACINSSNNVFFGCKESITWMLFMVRVSFLFWFTLLPLSWVGQIFIECNPAATGTQFIELVAVSTVTGLGILIVVLTALECTVPPSTDQLRVSPVIMLVPMLPMFAFTTYDLP